jgi:hypothetical protein
MTLVACVFIKGPSRLSCIPNPTISVFFYNNREGPLQALLKPSLSISHIMASGDTCPLRDLECTPCRHPCGAESFSTPFYHRQWKRTNCLHHRFDVWLRVTPFNPTHSCSWPGQAHWCNWAGLRTREVSWPRRCQSLGFDAYLESTAHAEGLEP